MSAPPATANWFCPTVVEEESFILQFKLTISRLQAYLPYSPISKGAPVPFAEASERG